MDRKQFVAATLFATALLTLILTPLAQQQGGGNYDPWLDYNEDGKIDANELYPLGQAYGTSGDPTKNVTITGHATKAIIAATNVVVPYAGSWNSEWITVDGYSKVTVNIWFERNMNEYSLIARTDPTGFNFYPDHVMNFEYYLVKTYDVMNQQIRVNIHNLFVDIGRLSVVIYLIA